MTTKQFKQYQTIVKRIALQQHLKNNLIFDLDELESAGWEGVLEGLQKYDPAKSKMTEKSVVSYYVRFAILCYLNKGAQLIPRSQHAYQKGQAPSKVSIEDVIYKDLEGENGEYIGRESEINEIIEEYEEYNYTNEISLIFKELPDIEVSFIKDEYGIGCKKISRKEMCKKYNVTSGYISIRIKKALIKIRSNKQLMNLLKRNLWTNN